MTSVTPASGATGNPVSVAPTATFNQAVVPNTVSFTMKTSGGTKVAGSVSFNGGNTVATFTPTNSLAASTTYTATVSGAQNTAGTPMSQPVQLELHHRHGVPVPVQRLAERDADGCGGRADTSAVNLGVQFRATSSGTVDRGAVLQVQRITPVRISAACGAPPERCWRRHLQR